MTATQEELSRAIAESDRKAHRFESLPDAFTESHYQ
jgi:hypothetical protein